MSTICFIGFGNMAQSIAEGLHRQPGYHLFAASPSLSAATTDHGIHTHPDNRHHLAKADVVIIAVKPVNVTQVLQEIQDTVPAHAVIVSIAAGVSLATLASACRPGQAVVRCMPNTPIAVGKGATPLLANAFVTAAQKQTVSDLFQCSGITTWLEREDDVNAFTALSGSGPAYVFLFAEALQEAAQKLGLTAELAKRFSLQTLSGAVALLEQSGLPPDVLRKKVTSPAGTTAAAVAILQQHGLNQLLYDAMHAAFARARELDQPAGTIE